MTDSPRIRPVELFAFNGAQVLDVAGPLQVLTSANELLVKRGDRAGYAPRVVSRDGGQIDTSAGLPVASHPLPSLRARIDTLIVSGGYGADAAALDEKTIDWVQRRAARARRTASVCTGAFVLATAGLLDGKRATTHWSSAERLAEHFPAVAVDPEPIYIVDGSVWTSAGVTAGIDMTLAMVEADLGVDVALGVARRLVVYLKRPGGQSQFSAALAAQASSTRFATLHDWLRANLTADLSVPMLAAQVNMSERNFTRVYTADVGTTPAVTVERLRVEAARRKLEAGVSVDQAAAAAGFGSSETMRRGFLRTLGVGPAEYRRRFAAPDA